jgi:signal transduction histidine kinase
MEMLRDRPPSTGEQAMRGFTRSFRAPLVFTILASLLVFSAVGLGLILAVNNAAKVEGLRDAGVSGEQAARVALAPFLTSELLRREPAAVDAVDRAGRAMIATGDVLRLKIWSQEQQVLWSDETSLNGKYFALEDEAADLFLSQGSHVAVTNLSKSENTAELAEFGDRMLEVYFGARTSDGTPILVETYYRYSLVADHAEELRSRFMPLAFSGLALLALAQVPLAILLARRLGKVQRERERLLERVISASDAERRRIAAEVHDGAVQDLIGVMYALEAAADDVPEPTHQRLHDLAGNTRTTVRRLRSLLNSIYPVEVPEAGWSSGFNDLVAALEAHGVRVTVDIDDVELAPMDELLLLRVTRESLRNVAAHAEATEVLVRLKSRLGRLHLEVRDNGRGFTASKADKSRSQGHLGLQLLHDLAQDVGADLSIDSAPGAGTALKLEMAGQR